MLRGPIEGLVLTGADAPRHPLRIDGARFLGPVRLEGCRLPSVVARHATFLDEVVLEPVVRGATTLSHCLFEREVRGQRASFGGSFTAEETRFLRRLTLSSTRFGDRVDLTGVVLDRGARFDGSTFARSVSFREARAGGRLDLRGARFGAALLGTGARFEEGIDLENARLASLRLDDVEARGPVVLKRATLGHVAYLHRARLVDLVLRGATIEAPFHLRDARVSGTIDGVGLVAHDALRLDGARCEGPVDLGDSTHHRDLVLRDAVFGSRLSLLRASVALRLDAIGARFEEVALAEATVGDLVLERRQVEGRLASVRALDHAAAANAFLLLRQHFERRGRHEDADHAYVGFRRAERSERARRGLVGAAGAIVERLVFDASVRYGTAPGRVGLLAAFVVAGFALLYRVAEDQLVVEGVRGAGVTLPQAFHLSAASFSTLGTEAIQPAIDGWLKHCVIAEGFLGLLLTAVFVGVVTRKLAK